MVWSKADCYAPIIALLIVHLLAALTLKHCTTLKQGNHSKHAFMQSSLPPDEATIICPPSDCPVSVPNTLRCLKKSLYGLCHTPCHWHKLIVSHLESSEIGLKHCPNELCCFCGHLILGKLPYTWLCMWMDLAHGFYSSWVSSCCLPVCLHPKQNQAQVIWMQQNMWYVMSKPLHILGWNIHCITTFKLKPMFIFPCIPRLLQNLPFPWCPSLFSGICRCKLGTTGCLHTKSWPYWTSVNKGKTFHLWPHSLPLWSSYPLEK